MTTSSTQTAISKLLSDLGTLKATTLAERERRVRTVSLMTYAELAAGDLPLHLAAADAVLADMGYYERSLPECKTLAEVQAILDDVAQCLMRSAVDLVSRPERTDRRITAMAAAEFARALLSPSFARTATQLAEGGR